MMASVRDRRDRLASGPSVGKTGRQPSDHAHAWSAAEVQVWSLVTDLGVDDDADVALLDDEERARTERFHFDRDRVRYLRGHAFTRRVLGQYLGLHPAAVRISSSVHGKPELDRASGITFSTSRDDGVTIVAVAPGRAVGVDVERLRPIDDALEMARGLFAEPEVALLESLSPDERARVFLSLWTRKESFVKAVGAGLSIPLDSFVSLAIDGGASGRHTSSDGILPYAFAQFDGPTGYVGAVTAAGSQVHLRQMDPAAPNRQGAES